MDQERQRLQPVAENIQRAQNLVSGRADKVITAAISDGFKQCKKFTAVQLILHQYFRNQTEASAG